ncbi:hypothetical protein P9199_13240 [Geobacillus stearothermophilus]|uniref:hypothetical protein n=1 Tax=Geobacillus stearothermophilus TaxID=1422 RepID=UPI002E247250|nr:hypothetical protein [Geobacillus stearothermophilus]
MAVVGWESCLHYCDRRKLAVVKEKGREIRFVNKGEKRVALYRVDGCLIQEGVKCDFLFLVIEGDRAFFIELKGSDLKQAVHQIARTIEQLGKWLPGYRFEGRIVTTRVRTPALKSTYLMKLEKMLRRTGGTLVVKAKWDEVNV